MNATIGDISLYAALFVAAVTVIASLGAARFATSAFFAAARWGFVAFAAFMGVCSWALLRALYQSDFSLAYVVGYTERALPLGYKLSAFWAGQEGSLLFWGVLLAAMGLVYAIAQRRNESRANAITLLVLALVCAFFAALVQFAANPFASLAFPPEDGRGLNPMLQNIGMIAHPPTLFIGYAGFTIPFALMIGAMVAGKIDNEWVGIARRWVVFSWIFLTVGIVLGAQWAYVELGWGGYWAWDPVENASLLPWLTGTALLHSTVGQQQRGMFRISNVAYAAVTFLLCIFGTYITRSGVIQSVHAFPKSGIAAFFLVFLILFTLLSIAAIALRLGKLRQQPGMEGIVSKEGALLTGNTMLILMTALTLLGTVFPLVSGLMAGQPITVTQGFYNRAVLPFAILMLLMMGVAPLLSYGAADLKKLASRLLIPAIVMVLALGATVLMGYRSLWALSCVAAISLTVTSVLADFVAVVYARRGNGLIRALVSTIDGNHRRYGGHLAHLGVAMIVAGVAGSSLYSTKATLQLTPGGKGTVGGYTLQLESLKEIQGENFTGVRGIMSVTDAAGRRFTLDPEIRQYAKSEQNNAEVAFSTGLLEDLYVTLVGYEREGSDVVAFQVVVNPLVIWIWIGGSVMVLGGIWCMLPVMFRQSAAAVADEKGPVSAEVVSSK